MGDANTLERLTLSACEGHRAVLLIPVPSANLVKTRTYDVFISYARTDLAIARALDRRLRMIGYRVFLDETGIPGGEPWRREIDHALDASTVVVGILSGRSRRRDYPVYEWARAKDKLWLLRIDGVPVPSPYADRQAFVHEDDLVAALRAGGVTTVNGCCEISVQPGRHPGVAGIVVSCLSQTKTHRELVGDLRSCWSPDESHPFDAGAPASHRLGDALGAILDVRDAPRSAHLDLDAELLSIPWGALRVARDWALDRVEIGFALSDSPRSSSLRQRSYFDAPSHWVSTSSTTPPPSMTVVSSLADTAALARGFDFDADHLARLPLTSVFAVDLQGASPDFVHAAAECIVMYQPICLLLRSSFAWLRSADVQAMARSAGVFCHVPGRNGQQRLETLTRSWMSGGIDGLESSCRDHRRLQVNRPWLWPLVFRRREEGEP